MTPVARLLSVLILLGLPALAAEPAPDAGPDGAEPPTAGGRLIVDGSSELDLLGDMWVDLPIAVARGRSIFLGLDTRTNIRQPTSDLAFELRDLDYELSLGFRMHRGWFLRRPASFFLAQRGKEGVDISGQAYLRYVGFALESWGFRHYADSRPGGEERRRVEWRFHGGPVLQQREVEADFVLSGGARVSLSPLRRSRGPLFELDLDVDGLFSGGGYRADVAFGPSMVFPVAGARRAKLFVHYLNGENPLGLGHSALLAGVEYSGQGATGMPPPEIDGSLAAGGGEGRLAGVLNLRFLTPRFAGNYRGAFAMDANILTAEDTGELYYIFHVGIERSLGSRVAGIYVYHRSNHQLAEPNDNVTSVNVLEFGIETGQWHRVGRRPVTGRWGRLDGRAAPGILLTSSFGEDRLWHFRGGARWSLPLAARSVAPFLYAEVEAGDVERQVIAVGVSPLDDLDFQLEYRNDQQYFGVDQTALLFLVRYGFQSYDPERSPVRSR